MERAITLTTLIYVCLVLLNISSSVHARDIEPWLLARHRKPTKLTTNNLLPNKTTIIAPTVENPNNAIDNKREFYHPAAVSRPRLIERYDKRSLDGHYEYRYVLSNGDVRYERAYWQPVGHTKVLARKGFYSYPLPNHRFHTVFYTADHNGFREDESSYTRTQPNLPRSLEIAATDVVSEKLATEKKKNKINRKPNWTPVTTTILQKGRIGQIAQETGIETGIRMGTEASTAITSFVEEVETSASSITNRPQINIEAAGVTEATETTVAKEELTRDAVVVTQAISASGENEAINPIKVESAQTTTIETETEQLEAVDTTRVLSVD